MDYELWLVRYGRNGTQLAALHQAVRPYRWVGHKWRANGRTWTGRVTVSGGDLIRQATAEDVRRLHCTTGPTGGPIHTIHTYV